MTAHTKATVIVVAFLIVAGFFFSPSAPARQTNSAAPAPQQAKRKLNLLEQLASAKVKLAAKPSKPTASERSSNASQETLNNMYRMISASNRMSRFQAAKFLAAHGDEQAIPYLIKALSDESSPMGVVPDEHPGSTTVRYWANLGLTRITGQDLGFSWNAAPDQRERAILQWRTWYMSHYSNNSEQSLKQVANKQDQDMIGRFGN